FTLPRLKRRLFSLQQLRGERQRGERRAQLVRERFDQVAARPVVVAQISEVLQNEQGAERGALGAMERDGLQHVGMIAPAYVQLDLGARPVRRSAPQPA